MIKVGAPEQLPGHCFFCRSSNREAFVDTLLNTEIDDVFGFSHGAVYVCEECVAEMATLLGFVRPKELELLKELKEHLTKKNYELEAEALELRQALESLIRANYVRDVDADTPDSEPAGV